MSKQKSQRMGDGQPSTLIREFFGKEADFFINAKTCKISQIKKLDRERSAVEITFEVNN